MIPKLKIRATITAEALLSGVEGDVDECEITEGEREDGVDASSLILKTEN